ncbi:ATP synthase subunit I [Phormidium sp. CCY1219]|uniref:ATP synthase subunit I n=1 Tax=Phormidium sp. CCY1219 TaxID=2886104 RepID=UPI002D1EA7B6|nr:ATP synthase subunit I [Phormidium sp. CCY1219]MEB3829609.1 ATP synthase subunit I [Phormidium sp. CCY1219]
MNVIFPLLFIALPAGFALGVFYFASLWITVRQLPTTQWPARLFIGSYLGRVAITLLGFYIVMNGQWESALVCLLGFLIARAVLTQVWHPKEKVKLF